MALSISRNYISNLSFSVLSGHYITVVFPLVCLNNMGLRLFSLHQHVIVMRHLAVGMCIFLIIIINVNYFDFRCDPSV